MNREVAVLILLVALLAIVLLCIGTGSQEDAAAVRTDLPAKTPRTLKAVSDKGIVWANWRDRKETEVETAETPARFEVPAAGIPKDVAERLARDYKGMDVYVSRGTGHE